MIGLDTNVLVRYIMQDDVGQSPQATALIESLTVETPGFVPLVSVIELTWVLIACFGLDRSQIVAALEGLMRSKEIVVERADIVWQSVRVFRDGTADFADCLIERSAASAGCERTMTFDRGAAKSCGMILIQ
jgi:predicted nucleic-acid-binding protein